MFLYKSCSKSRLSEHALYFAIVGLPRFELGQTEPKPVVLPLHHSPNINQLMQMLILSKSDAKVRFFAIRSKYISVFFLL